jgi:ABC-2 type transport system ATP-binding protein
VVSESLEVRRRVGYLPESVPLYPDMTVVEYLRYMADLRHLPDPEARISTMIAQVDLGMRANNRIGNLSKGMRQRVGLAQSLLHEPEVVILDEPTLGLDPGQIIGIRQLIREIGRNRTVLLSTHILSEAQQVCDRVLIIHKGNIVAEDTPARLQAHITGAKRILVHVRGDGEGLGAVIRAVAGVTQVSVLDDGKVEFSIAPGQDIRPQVARAIHDANYDLLELRSLAISLEDIFLKLTRDEATEPDTEYHERANPGVSRTDDIAEGVKG